MARSDSTLPYRLRTVRKWRRGWWTRSDDIAFLRRELNRRDRHDARAELRRGEDPEPRQPRGRAIWEAY